MSDKRHSIIDAMCHYAARKPIRMHMPGHKGKKAFSSSSGAEPTPQWANALLDELRAIDMTESPGLDNLHYPTGCIREVERRAERLYGSARTYMLVNGATSGIQASLLATRMTLGAGNIILPRNVHKSMVTAMAMSGLEPVYVWPEYDRRLGGHLPLDAHGVRKALESQMSGQIEVSPRAVLVLNPTYSGFARNLTEIADLVHSCGALLIVDEAHGSHFGLGSGLPPSALECGADLVVHGAHKTTVAFTQTAFLHVGPQTPERFPALLPAVEEALRAVQTTSPSYILLASLEQAIANLEKDGGAWVSRGVSSALEVSRRLAKIPGLSVAGYDPSAPIPQGLSHDPGRVLIDVSGLGISGPEAAHYLITEKKIDPEMTGPQFLLLIWTGADGLESVEAVEAAFKDLAARFFGSDTERQAAEARDEAATAEAVSDEDCTHSLLLQEAPRPKRVMSLREAFLSVSEPVPIRESVGRISSDTVVIYPPGSPLITPGEVIDGDTVEYILQAKEAGLNVLGRGVDNGQSQVNVYCVSHAYEKASDCVASS
jgi:arginine decarboxylase